MFFSPFSELVHQPKGIENLSFVDLILNSQIA